jgi:hypothetical protein
VRYVQRVSRTRISYLAREYWFELLIAVLAIAAMLELVIGRNSPGAPSTTLWFAVPAVALMVLPLFARRRFPFAGPAAYWLGAAALSFVDGMLVPFMVALFPVGLASAFLLGNLRSSRQAWTGLAVAGVTVRYSPDELEIEIRDNGQGSATSDGLGHGLVGVRERVKIYGGEMTAGTATGGGFVLSTRLPLGQDQP